MDEAIRAQRNNIGVSKGFYTVSEAAKVLGVGQRRVLEMVETKELEGERDPTSSRWKISMQAVQELAAEESLDTKQPLLTENAAVTEEDTVELQVSEERQSTEEKSGTEEPLLTNQPPREDPTERFSEQSEEHLWERINELEQLHKRLQVEQQTEKAAWQEERGSLLTAANRGLQHNEELQKEVAGLTTELGASQERIDELERLNKRLQVEQQTEKAAWQEERGSLLAATDRERQHAEELREEVERLSTELETERGKGFVQRLFGG
jgi:excisionase family DNA binding protein